MISQNYVSTAFISFLLLKKYIENIRRVVLTLLCDEPTRWGQDVSRRTGR